MKIDELDTFELYLSIRAHFTTKYDFFQYRGKIRGASMESLLKKPYHKVICQLSKRYEAKELVDYFVSNMLIENGTHTFDIDAGGLRVFSEYCRRKSARTYIFTSDIKTVCHAAKDRGAKSFDECLRKPKKSEYPFLLHMFLGGKIHPETMCILRKVLDADYVPAWDESINDILVWPDARQLITKYTDFIRIRDFSPMKEIFLTTCSETF